MTPVIPSSTSNISLIPGAAFPTTKKSCLTRCCIVPKSTKQALNAQGFILPLSTSLRLFPYFRSGCSLHHKARTQIVSATGTDVAVEEPDSPVADKDSGEALGMPSAVGMSEESSIKSDASPTQVQSKRPRPTRKSEMPPVKNEELVLGATFTGKVRSIQPFGAFVDFGAFTDGLVHVSRLSDSFVKDVGAIVSVGQEVKVRLLEVNIETGRISLTMRESDDISKLQQPKDAPADSDKTRPPRRSNQKSNQRKEGMTRTTKFVKGQDLQGTVKNLTRAGAFISLPEGEEGFLPTSEESVEGFANIMGGSSLQAGEEVSVRVLRITRGQVTLTMKREEDVGVLDSKLNQGVVHTATNPFLLAFRENKDIASFLDEREKEEEPTDNSKGLISIPSAVDEMVANNETSQKEEDVGASMVGDALTEITKEGDEDPESVFSDALQTVDGAVQSIVEESKEGSEILVPEGSASTADCITEAAPVTEGLESDGESELSGQIVDQTLSSDKMISKEDGNPESAVSDALETVDGTVQSVEEEAEESSEILAPEGSASTADHKTESVPVADGVKSDEESYLSGQIADQVLSSRSLISSKDESPESIVSDALQTVDGAVQSIEEEDESSKILVPEGSASTADHITDLAPVTDGLKSDGESDLSGQIADQILSSGVQSVEVEAEESSKILAPEGSASTADHITELAPVTDGVRSDGESDLPGQIADQTLSSDSLISNEDEDPESIVSDALQTVDGALQTVEEKAEESSEILASEGSASFADRITKSAPAADGVRSDGESDLSGQIADQFLSSGSLIGNKDKDPESELSDALETVDGAVQSVEEEAEGSSEILVPEGSISTADHITESAPVADGVRSDGDSDLSGKIADQTLSSDSLISKEVTETATNMNSENIAPNSSRSVDVAVQGMEEAEGVSSEIFAPAGSSVDQITEGALSMVGVKNDGESDDKTVKDEVQIQKPSAESETSSPTPVEHGKMEPKDDENSSITSSEGQLDVPPSQESTSKAAISPALVKQLREETGAGMMACKNALSETGGDIIKAQEYLRKKGLASADKKASRATTEGRIGSYIHDGRIGVLIEVNCETDFVSRGDIFKELVDDLAMQVAACPQVQHLATEDVPNETMEKEREIEMQKEDLLSKPEAIRSKIVDGRIKKRLEELALLEQPYIKNDKVLVKDWVKQTIATIGENMKVKRFVRYNLGEGLEKKSQDFAAEVAAQTAAKQVPTSAKELPAAVEAKEEKPPKATVSAALVKQLREETGAGMMDCKKALSETGGNLEKAQEYLRKKGLSSADKKSSRLAAEGRIGSYIHDSRIGVLIEINCETDFVGRSEKFKELVDDLAMQVVACPQVQYVSIEDIPETIVSKEKELEMQREDILSKPENIRERIIGGRVSKRLGELALLEQPFIKNDGVLVKDLVKQTVAALGENIKVRRFVRFTLGESTDAKTESKE